MEIYLRILVLVLFAEIYTQAETLESKLHRLQNQIEQQVEINTKFATKIEEIENSNGQLQARLKQLENHNVILSDKNNQLEVKLNKFEETRTPGLQNNTVVSFTAYATQTRTIDEGEIVMFDGLVNNYGEAYDSSTGIFACPLDGYYLFQLNTHSTPAEYVEVEIQLDGTLLVASSASDDDDSGSTSVVTFCGVAQQVWVVAQFNGQVMFGHDDLRYSSFSGTLLFLG